MKTRVSTRLKKTGIILALILAALMIAPSAFADTTTVTNADGTIATSGSVCGSTGISSAEQALPMQRWSDATNTYHVRVADGFFDLNSMGTHTNRTLGGSIIAVGNFLPGFATSLATHAEQFCPLNSAGWAADQFAAGIGKAFVATPILPILFAASFIAFIYYGMARAHWDIKKLLGKVLILALLVAMIAGAGATTGGKNGENLHPGPLSPSWFLTQLNSATNVLSSIPVAIINQNQENSSDEDIQMSGTSALDCRYLINGMKEYYSRAYGGAGTDESSTVGDAATATSVAISGIWENSGLQVWKNGQFGNNSIADATYCHLLESEANLPVNTVNDSDGAPSTVGSAYFWQLAWGKDAEPFPDEAAHSVALYTGTNTQTIDEKMVALAACHVSSTNPADWANDSTFTINQDFAAVDKIDPGACRLAFWNDDWNANQVDFSNDSDDTSTTTDLTPEKILDLIDAAKDSSTSIGGATPGKSTVCTVDDVNDDAVNQFDQGSIAPDDGTTRYMCAKIASALKKDPQGTLKDAQTAADASNEQSLEDNIQSDGDAFNFDPANSEKSVFTNSGLTPLAQDYILRLHSERMSTNLLPAIIWMVAGLALGVAFTAMAGGIFVAKIAAIVLIAMLTVVLITALISTPGRRMMNAGKQLIGVSVYTILMQTVMAIVSGLTALLTTSMASIIGGGNLLTIAWAACCPIVILVMIVVMMKRAGLPNIMSPMGAMALAGSVSALDPKQVVGGAKSKLMSTAGKAQRFVSSRNRHKDLMGSLSNAEKASAAIQDGAGRAKPGAGKDKTNAAKAAGQMLPVGSKKNAPIKKESFTGRMKEDSAKKASGGILQGAFGQAGAAASGAARGLFSDRSDGGRTPGLVAQFRNAHRAGHGNGWLWQNKTAVAKRVVGIGLKVAAAGAIGAAVAPAGIPALAGAAGLAALSHGGIRRIATGVRTGRGAVAYRNARLTAVDQPPADDQQTDMPDQTEPESVETDSQPGIEPGRTVDTDTPHDADLNVEPVQDMPPNPPTGPEKFDPRPTPEQPRPRPERAGRWGYGRRPEVNAPSQ